MHCAIVQEQVDGLENIKTLRGQDYSHPIQYNIVQPLHQRRQESLVKFSFAGLLDFCFNLEARKKINTGSPAPKNEPA
jgi:hypothetical protein